MSLTHCKSLRAVIDIGSNSVRLVMYALDGVKHRPWLDEKCVAGLGRDLEQTGILHPEGKRLALEAIRRFACLLRAHRVPAPLVFATAAVRESTDGEDFVRLIENDLNGVTVHILSGCEEAAMSAHGVLAALKNACGLVCDLGGRSLEVTSVANQTCGNGDSRPIGPLALESLGDATHPDVLGTVEDAVRALTTPASRLYLVGGSWRALGRLHQQMSTYPLPVIHNYTIASGALRSLLAALSRSDAKILRTADQLSPRRCPHFPYAALVLDRLIAQSRAKDIVFSGVGVREGMLATHPVPTDPDASVGNSFGAAIAAWLSGLTPVCGEQNLVDHACDLIDITQTIPSCRAETAFALALHAPWTSLTHAGRTCVALSVACRYRRGYTHAISQCLLGADQTSQARALGAVLRLGADMSGGSTKLLACTDLTCSDTALELRIDPACRALASHLVEKRLSQAALALERTPKLLIERRKYENGHISSPTLFDVTRTQ